MFRVFTFNVVVDVVELKSTIILRNVSPKESSYLQKMAGLYFKIVRDWAVIHLWGMAYSPKASLSVTTDASGTIRSPGACGPGGPAACTAA